MSPVFVDLSHTNPEGLLSPSRDGTTGPEGGISPRGGTRPRRAAVALRERPGESGLPFKKRGTSKPGGKGGHDPIRAVVRFAVQEFGTS